MPGIANWKISPETRARFMAILDEAPRFGIDRDQAVAAGLPALRALIGLKKAAEAQRVKTRNLALTETRDALRGVVRRNPKLASQFEARILAMLGRGGDTEVVHVARGEIVVPRALQSHAVLAALKEAAASYGIPIARLLVGSASMSINPDTGSPEFSLEDSVDGNVPAAAGMTDVQAQAGTRNSADDASARAGHAITHAPVWRGNVNQKDKPGEGEGTFGSRRDGNPPRTHQGIDIQSTVGEPIFAAGPGKVVRADGRDVDGYGNQVIIDHGNGVQTRLGHLDSMFVKPGDQVSGGQAVGRAGRTGNPPPKADPHVHYEVSVDGVRIDPYPLVPGLRRRSP